MIIAYAICTISIERLITPSEQKRDVELHRKLRPLP
jgi:hypothetical protein